MPQQLLYNKVYINEQVQGLADKINADYSQTQKPLLVIFLLNGAMFFGVDLVRKLNMDVEIDTIGISSYIENEQFSIKVTKKLQTPVDGRDVLIVDEFCDRGRTLAAAFELVKQGLFKGPRSIECCCLLNRINNGCYIKYKAIEVPQNKWLFGYGLDNFGIGRNLKQIYCIDYQK